MNSQVEQTAVAASQPEPPQSANTDAALAGVQLRNLSIEHAAILTQLSPRELQVVQCLGRGLTDAEIATELAVPIHTVRHWRKQLTDRTRMDRLNLAVLGYHLLGQETIHWREAA
jgi:DNA-binding NarL/FixJ family response regulator